MDLLHNLTPNNFGVGMGVATIIGGYGLIKLRKKYRDYRNNLDNRDKLDKQDDLDNKKARKEIVKDWMAKDFVNLIIKWKRNNPGEEDNYLLFIRDKFPENINIGPMGKVEWIDPRISGKRWLGAFSRVNATDDLHDLDEPPGIDPAN